MSPARIADRVRKGREPCLVAARKGARGMLVPFEPKYLPVLESHPRVIDALLKDLKKPGTDMAMYCLQVGLTNEQDAFRFLDGQQRPVLALVGVKRFQRWEKQQAAPGGSAKVKPVAAKGKAPAKGKPAMKRKGPAKGTATAKSTAAVTGRSAIRSAAGTGKATAPSFLSAFPKRKPAAPGARRRPAQK